VSDFKSIDDCAAEETVRYLKDYFATVDIINEALGKYETLAANATSVAGRNDFRALALEADRDLELLKSRRLAFLAGDAEVEPPSQAQVDKAQDLSQKLAKIAAKEAQAKAIIKIATDGLNAFNKLHPS
jgi:hypothetical protein